MVEISLNHIFLHLATLTQLSLLKNIFHFLSEAVRCGALQKRQQQSPQQK